MPYRFAAVFVIVFVVSVPLAFGSDLPGSQDPPHVSRYQGCEIVGYDRRDFDQYVLTLKPTKRFDDPKSPERGQTLEGAYSGVAYTCPAGRSTLEVLRNYERSLKRAGFAILFQCYRNCGQEFATHQTDVPRTPVKDQWQFWGTKPTPGTSRQNSPDQPEPRTLPYSPD
jgi:hypothetical protein